MQHLNLLQVVFLLFFLSLSFSPSAPTFRSSLHLSLSRGNLLLFFGCVEFSWLRQQMEGYFVYVEYVNVCMGRECVVDFSVVGLLLWRCAALGVRP